MVTAYQRARSPEQKAQRSEQILAAAEEMLADGHNTSTLSLTELARRAGMAKSNVYRYFESREAVLLALLQDRTERWVEEVVATVSAVSKRKSTPRRLQEVGDALAATLTTKPVMCQLMSVLPSVLEHNAAEETVRSYKLASLAQLRTLASAMHGVVHELPVESHAELLHHAFAFIVGGWPLAHPSPVTAQVMGDPELAPFRHDFGPDLSRVVVLLARGMLAE